MSSVVRVKMEIILNEDGTINVSGPLEDKILSFGLLEMAKLVVAQFQPQAANKIVKVPPGAKIVDIGKH